MKLKEEEERKRRYSDLTSKVWGGQLLQHGLCRVQNNITSIEIRKNSMLKGTRHRAGQSPIARQKFRRNKTRTGEPSARREHRPTARNVARQKERRVWKIRGCEDSTRCRQALKSKQLQQAHEQTNNQSVEQTKKQNMMNQ